MNQKKAVIWPDMTVLDVVSRYRTTEAVFKSYDEQAGECICCQSLFDTLQEMSGKYDLNLPDLIAALKAAV